MAPCVCGEILKTLQCASGGFSPLAFAGLALRVARMFPKRSHPQVAAAKPTQCHTYSKSGPSRVDGLMAFLHLRKLLPKTPAQAAGRIWRASGDRPALLRLHRTPLPGNEG